MPTRRRTASAKAADSTDAAVGQNIRIERLARHMSQTDLADQIGVSFQQVQKYEKGRNRVGSGRLARIAEALGFPLWRCSTAQRPSPSDRGSPPH